MNGEVVTIEQGSGGMGTASAGSGIVLFLVFGLIYFAPTFFAAARGHQSGMGIFILNLVFGWTLLGWIIALIWSLSATGRSNDSMGRIKAERPRGKERKCPHCAEYIKLDARICRFCDRDVTTASIKA